MGLYSILWLVLAIVLAVCEFATVGLFCIWFSIGSLGALAASLMGFGLPVQLIVFTVLSAVSLFLVRPAAARIMRLKRTPTNADRIIGRTARVVQDIDNISGRGQVNVSGQIWTARSENDTKIPAGSQVRILRIEGVKAFVEAAPPAESA